jgi:hypothetical protein
MNDERVRRVRLLPDGEELVAYEQWAPAPQAVGGEDPLTASAERRHLALAERRRKPRSPSRPVAAAPPPPR